MIRKSTNMEIFQLNKMKEIIINLKIKIKPELLAELEPNPEVDQD
jgi:hypothetical protein